ncbi:unnamed protein product [Paramecium sonneborni]|uniref:Uncharacterized protein n=1 Tax=Paramecium sonneborni TaxID=65129 RepID=A0A8S1L8F5_9CILI|nr:unnamed protein product [Paramecium sonneborni]
MNCCIDHPQKEYSLICIAQHYCQRKLCQECQHDHGIDSKQLVSINKFQNKLKKRMEKFNLNTQINYNNYNVLHQNLKSLIVQTEEMIKNMCQNITQSINNIFKILEQEDQQYHILLNSFDNLLELSYIDLNKLVEILNDKTLEKWNDQKEQNINQLRKAQLWLQIELESFLKRFNQDLMKDIESLIKVEKKVESIEEYYWQEGIIEHEFWEYSNNYGDKIPVKQKFTITKTKDKEIIYTYPGINQRIDQIKELCLKKPEILHNIDQIRHLQWIGEYGNNNKKVGKWIAIWKGLQLFGVGGLYSDDGKKQGRWKELIPNFCDEAQIFESGEYLNDERNGIWKYIYSSTEIGGGLYLENGKKNGLWIELSDNFWNLSQVTYQGEYEQDKKFGKWIIKYHNELIGQGQFLNNGLKNGDWVEQAPNFYCDCQVTYNGIYKKGKKIAKWDINYRYNSDQPFEQIGGGIYDDHSLKTGKWIELSEKFQKQLLLISIIIILVKNNQFILDTIILERNMENGRKWRDINLL